MTFTDIETSVHAAAPIELYRFTSPNNVYRYTSAGASFTLEAEFFEAVPIQRTAVQGTAQDDPAALEVEIGITADVVQDFAFGIAENNLRLELLRSHGGPLETGTIWEGDVISISVNGRLARMRIPSRFESGLAAPVPSIYYQSQCNHALYDNRCRVNRQSFEFDTTVQSVDGVDLRLASVNNQVDDWFKSGSLLRVSDNERRLIISQIGTSITLNYPFRELEDGDDVQIVAGCDRTVMTCRDKFSNVENFGGYPLIPILNVFEAGLK